MTKEETTWLRLDQEFQNYKIKKSLCNLINLKKYILNEKLGRCFHAWWSALQKNHMMQKWDDNIKVKDLLCSLTPPPTPPSVPFSCALFLVILFATLVPIFFQVYNAHAVLQHFREKKKHQAKRSPNFCWNLAFQCKLCRVKEIPQHRGKKKGTLVQCLCNEPGHAHVLIQSQRELSSSPFHFGRI